LVIEAREALGNAHAARAKAESGLESARAATTRARALLEGITRQIEDHEASEIRASTSLTAEIKSSLMTGATLSLSANDRETAKSAGARAALEARGRAAEQVVADLAAEEHEAEEVLNAANSVVADAVKGVLRATAAQIGQRWLAVNAESRALRQRLAQHFQSVGRLDGLDAATKAAIEANNKDETGEDFRAQARADACWIEYAASLLRDPDSLIDFTPVDVVSPAARYEPPPPPSTMNRLSVARAAE
jgi:hypothetical protein